MAAKTKTVEHDYQINEILKVNESIYEYFLIDEDKFEHLKGFKENNLSSSVIFNDVFQATTVQIKSSEGLKLPLGFSQVINFIFIPALYKTRDLFTDFENGSIDVAIIKRSLQEYQNISEMEKDFENWISFLGINFPISDLKECIAKINCINKMDSCAKQAKAILDAADKLGLTGDFSIVKEIRSQGLRKVLLLFYCNTNS